MCSAIGALPRSMQDYLISWWQQLSNDEFRGFVHRVQNFITIRITSSSVQALNRDEAVTAATKVMCLLSACLRLSCSPDLVGHPFTYTLSRCR